MSGSLDEPRSVADLIQSTTHQGVPVLLAPNDGPLSAGLAFRAGRGDEPLAASGITHLIEHLALIGRDDGDIHHNGETNDTFTHFHVSGRETEVVAFLNGVCRALREPPLERMELEKDVLRAEATHRASVAADRQRIERYGARGPGTVAYGEVGLHAIEPRHVTAWAQTRFTRGNAVLWIAGDRIPDGLALDLPDGPRHPVPDWEELARPRPGYFLGAQGGALLDAVIPRSVAAGMFARVAGRLLHRTLRVENAYSYATECGYEPLQGSRARVTMFADALPERHVAVAEGLVGVLARLRDGDVDARDLEIAVDAVRRTAELPSLGASMLASSAINLLMDHPITHPDELVREAETVTVDDIAAVAELVWSDALVQAADGDLEALGIEPIPLWSTDRVEGERFVVDGDPQFSLVIGDSGVSFSTPQGDATVLYENCVGYLTRPDGARTLIGADGFRVAIEPNQYLGLEQALAGVDERVPRDAVIPLPARTADEIPQPPGKPMHWRGYGPWAGVLSGLLLLMLAFIAPTAWAMTALLSELGDDAPMSLLDVMRLWIITGILAGGAVLFIAGARRRTAWKARYGG